MYMHLPTLAMLWLSDYCLLVVLTEDKAFRNVFFAERRVEDKFSNWAVPSINCNRQFTCLKGAPVLAT